MQTDSTLKRPVGTLFSAFDRYLNAENEVLRSAAIQALPLIGDTDEGAVREALISALLDPDPDIRSDAMEALLPFAKPEQAATLRKSLEGDPVREVKLAAISALARLNDRESIPLLRALVRSRSEDRVAWEDEGADWEDWLDVQTAAINAIGDMGAREAIDDLIDALFDDFGQSVVVPVCNALLGMGGVGIAVLLEVINQTDGRTRRIAASALSDAAPEDLRTHLEGLLEAEDGKLRGLALKVLAPDDPRIVTLARTDPEPAIRAAALYHGASVLPDLAHACLSDADDIVKAAALECLSPPFDPEFHEALVDNMIQWLGQAKPVLGAVILGRLPELAPNRALGPLLQVIDSPERELELRVAAAKALQRPELDVPPALISARLQNPSRQVRTALLTVLRQRAGADDDWIALAASVIAGRFEIDAELQIDPHDTAGSQDVGTPKEGTGPRKIWITPDGDIVDHKPETLSESNGTLDAILAGAVVEARIPKPAEDTPEESGAKRAKRRAVEGSGEIADTLAIDAMRLFCDVDNTGLVDAILSRASEADQVVLQAAWQSLSLSPVDTPVVPDLAETAARNSDQIVRAAAFRILAKFDRVDSVAHALSDEDPVIRSEAVSRLPGNAALDFMADPASIVVRAAVDCILATKTCALIKSAVDRAVVAENSAALNSLIQSSEAARLHAFSVLEANSGSDRKALVVMRGLAQNRSDLTW